MRLGEAVHPAWSWNGGWSAASEYGPAASWKAHGHSPYDGLVAWKGSNNEYLPSDSLAVSWKGNSQGYVASTQSTSEIPSGNADVHAPAILQHVGAQPSDQNGKVSAAIGGVACPLTTSTIPCGNGEVHLPAMQQDIVGQSSDRKIRVSVASLLLATAGALCPQTISTTPSGNGDARLLAMQQDPGGQSSDQKEELSAATVLLATVADSNVEPSRQVQPLQLMKERSPELAWQAMIDNPKLRSWAYIAREPAITMDDFIIMKNNIQWQELKSGWGLDEKLTRKVKWFTCKGCSCPYEYGSESSPAVQFPDWFESMTERWLGKLKLKDTEMGMPNCANINLYDGGDQAVSWHSDDEPLFKGTTQDACIISVSLGAARKFQVGLRGPRKGAYLKPEAGTTESAWLEHGHLATMEGRFQKHYLHQVAKTESATGPRINVTFRYNVAHVAPCPLAPPSLKDRAVVSLTLPATAPILKRGVQQRGPAINYSALQQTQMWLVNSSGKILRDILPWAKCSDVEDIDDPDWKAFPEIGAAYHEAGGDELSVCVAIYKKGSVWAAGFGGKTKLREPTARLALCLSLLLTTKGSAWVVHKYPGLGQLLEEFAS